MESDEWRSMMKRLEGYTGRVTRRVIPFKGGFQW